MNKLFSLKILGKITAVFFILLFLWVMFITTSPIKPRRVERYFACDVNNISSWDSTGGDLVVNSFKSALDPSTNYIEFMYQIPPKYIGQPAFFCKFPIPEMVLYKAITLNVTYKVNQPSFFDVGMRRVGQGPGWKPVKVAAANVNRVLTATWLLHDPDQPKFNWLSGSYEGITFGVGEFDRTKPLVLTIYRVYLE